MMDDKKLDEMLNRNDVPAFDPSKALGRALEQIDQMESGQNVVSFTSKTAVSQRSVWRYSYVGIAMAACMVLAVWFNVSSVEQPSQAEMDAYVAQMAALEAQHREQEKELLGLFEVAELEIRDENIELFIDELYQEQQNEIEFWDSLTDG